MIAPVDEEFQAQHHQGISIGMIKQWSQHPEQGVVVDAN